MPKKRGYGVKWYKERIKVIKRSKDVDKNMLKHLRKKIKEKEEKIAKFKKKLKVM